MTRQRVLGMGLRPVAISAGIAVCGAGLWLSAAGHAAVAGAMEWGAPQQNGTYVPPAVNRMPTTVDQEQMQQQHSDEARIEAANAERKKQIAEDSDKLLKMATELKEELDKTDKDTLSMSTVRKVDAIQKLVKEMKDKIRLRSN